VHRVELTPANAPATREDGSGNLGGSPFSGVKNLFAVSNANNCRYINKTRDNNQLRYSFEFWGQTTPSSLYFITSAN
jgi:hypothetical protein